MSKAKTQKVEVGKYAVVILCLLAEILMARGMLQSYSRGAWVATVCGLGYLVWRRGQALISKQDLCKRVEATPRRFCARLKSLEKPKPFGDGGAAAMGFAEVSKRQRHSCISQLNRNWLLFSIILAFFFLLVFWHFRQMNWHLARRALSIVNTTDFSGATA